MSYQVSHSGFVHVDFRCIRRSTEAALEIITEGNKIYWIPKSQVADARDYKAGDRNGTISITDKCAQSKGMI